MISPSSFGGRSVAGPTASIGADATWPESAGMESAAAPASPPAESEPHAATPKAASERKKRRKPVLFRREYLVIPRADWIVKKGGRTCAPALESARLMRRS